MTRPKGTFLFTIALLLGAVLCGLDISARDRTRVSVNAAALATTGRTISIDLIIDEISPKDDQKMLIDAFWAKKSKGIANALSKMGKKGRIEIPGTPGFNVHYTREFRTPDGTRKIRFVTDRPVTFDTAGTAKRSSTYNFAMGEISISADKRRVTGVLFPDAELTIDFDDELTVMSLKNLWTLTDIKVSD